MIKHLKRLDSFLSRLLAGMVSYNSEELFFKNYFIKIRQEIAEQAHDISTLMIKTTLPTPDKLLECDHFAGLAFKGLNLHFTSILFSSLGGDAQ